MIILIQIFFNRSLRLKHLCPRRGAAQKPLRRTMPQAICSLPLVVLSVPLSPHKRMPRRSYICWQTQTRLWKLVVNRHFLMALQAPGAALRQVSACSDARSARKLHSSQPTATPGWLLGFQQGIFSVATFASTSHGAHGQKLIQGFSLFPLQIGHLRMSGLLLCRNCEEDHSGADASRTSNGHLGLKYR